jgi:hypothetical protein
MGIYHSVFWLATKCAEATYTLLSMLQAAVLPVHRWPAVSNEPKLDATPHRISHLQLSRYQVAMTGQFSGTSAQCGLITHL